MKKLLVILMVLVLALSSVTAVLADYSGFFTTGITSSFCQGKTNRYAYWTKNKERRALLAIVLTQDLLRQDYLTYNALQPMPSLAGIIYSGNSKSGGVITVIYVGDNCCLEISYFPDNDQASYQPVSGSYDYQTMPAYARSLADKDNMDIQFTYHTNSAFGDSTDACSKAYNLWNSYLSEHPELQLSDQYIGW